MPDTTDQRALAQALRDAELNASVSGNQVKYNQKLAGDYPDDKELQQWIEKDNAVHKTNTDAVEKARKALEGK